MTVGNCIRIESDENVVTNARIFYVPEEGDEVDISRCVTGVDLHLHVGEVSRATLHVILVSGQVEASVEEVTVKQLKARCRGLRLRRLKSRCISWLQRQVARWLGDELRREIARAARR